MSKRVIVSISSDIGLALADTWLEEGHDIVGTYRTASDGVLDIEKRGARVVKLDLATLNSADPACRSLGEHAEGWSTLVVAAGLLDPIETFTECKFSEWAASFNVNFSAQLQIVHALLPHRKTGADDAPGVILFSGGGTNNATVGSSAYTVAKIAAIKMCELLDAEISDTKFSTIGPGWVKTKIHDSTLRDRSRSQSAYARTVQKLASDDCVPLHQVVECVDWVIGAPRDVVGGRNFSLVHDEWGNPALENMLREDTGMYKLRRNGNEKLVRAVPITEASPDE